MINKKAKKLKESEIKETTLMKKIYRKLLNELNPKDEVKNIVLIKTSENSMNCIPYYNYTNESEFTEQDSKETYALTDSIFELEGIPVYMVKKDTHVNYVMEFTDINELDKDKDKDKYKIKQKLMKASQIYQIHESTHIKNWMSKPKLDFNLSIAVLLLVALCCLITYIITYSIYYIPESELAENSLNLISTLLFIPLFIRFKKK